MTAKASSPLRRRPIEDMAIRRLGPKTQHDYIRRVKSFADFVGRFADKATVEDIHRYQMRLASIGATVSIVNDTASALRFFRAENNQKTARLAHRHDRVGNSSWHCRSTRHWWSPESTDG
jgi:hypothetical protein